MTFLSNSKKSLSEKLQIVRTILSPKTAKLMLDFVNSDQVKIKEIEIPYSFCVIDEKYTIFELPNPSSQGFYVAFVIQNAAFCKRLVETFQALWGKGKEHPLMKYFS